MQGPPVRLDGVSPGPLPPARQAATASPDGAHHSRGKQVPSLPLRGPAGGLASGPATAARKSGDLAVSNERLRSGLSSPSGRGAGAS